MRDDETDDRPDDPSRRTLLERSLGVAVTGVAAASLYPAVRFAQPPDAATAGPGSVSLDATTLGESAARIVMLGEEPVIVLRVPGGGVRAFSARCTHLGCTVRHRAETGLFECPCHGGKFSLEGHVVAGPPPAPLTAYEATEQDGRVVIERRMPWSAG